MLHLIVLLLTILPAATANAISLGEVPLVADIKGRKVTVPTRLDLAVNTIPAGMKVDVVARGNMQDFQQQFDALVKSFPLPNNNCARAGQNLLPTIETAKLMGQGNQARIAINGRAALWDCQKGPAGGTPVKNLRFEDSFSGQIPVALQSPDGKSIELVPGMPQITPGGGLSNFANVLAGIVNKDLSSLAKAEIDKLVNAGMFRKALPPGFEDLNPTIEHVQFNSEQNGRLYTDVHFSAVAPPDKIAALMRQVMAGQGKNLLKGLLR